MTNLANADHTTIVNNENKFYTDIVKNVINLPKICDVKLFCSLIFRSFADILIFKSVNLFKSFLGIISFVAMLAFTRKILRNIKGLFEKLIKTIFSKSIARAKESLYKQIIPDVSECSQMQIIIDILKHNGFNRFVAKCALKDFLSESIIKSMKLTHDSADVFLAKELDLLKGHIYIINQFDPNDRYDEAQKIIEDLKDSTDIFDSKVFSLSLHQLTTLAEVFVLSAAKRPEKDPATQKFLVDFVKFTGVNLRILRQTHEKPLIKTLSIGSIDLYEAYGDTRLVKEQSMISLACVYISKIRVTIDLESRKVDMKKCSVKVLINPDGTKSEIITIPVENHTTKEVQKQLFLFDVENEDLYLRDTESETFTKVFSRNNLYSIDVKYDLEILRKNGAQDFKKIIKEPESSYKVYDELKGQIQAVNNLQAVINDFTFHPSFPNFLSKWNAFHISSDTYVKKITFIRENAHGYKVNIYDDNTVSVSTVCLIETADKQETYIEFCVINLNTNELIARDINGVLVSIKFDENDAKICKIFPSGKKEIVKIAKKINPVFQSSSLPKEGFNTPGKGVIMVDCYSEKEAQDNKGNVEKGLNYKFKWTPPVELSNPNLFNLDGKILKANKSLTIFSDGAELFEEELQKRSTHGILPVLQKTVGESDKISTSPSSKKVISNIMKQPRMYEIIECSLCKTDAAGLVIENTIKTAKFIPGVLRLVNNQVRLATGEIVLLPPHEVSMAFAKWCTDILSKNELMQFLPAQQEYLKTFVNKPRFLAIIFSLGDVDVILETKVGAFALDKDNTTLKKCLFPFSKLLEAEIYRELYWCISNEEDWNKGIKIIEDKMKTSIAKLEEAIEALENEIIILRGRDCKFIEKQTRDLMKNKEFIGMINKFKDKLEKVTAIIENMKKKPYIEPPTAEIIAGNIISNIGDNLEFTYTFFLAAGLISPCLQMSTEEGYSNSFDKAKLLSKIHSFLLM